MSSRPVGPQRWLRSWSFIGNRHPLVHSSSSSSRPSPSHWKSVTDDTMNISRLKPTKAQRLLLLSAPVLYVENALLLKCFHQIQSLSFHPQRVNSPAACSLNELLRRVLSPSSSYWLRIPNPSYECRKHIPYASLTSISYTGTTVAGRRSATASGTKEGPLRVVKLW